MLITLSEAQIGDRFLVKHVELTNIKNDRLTSLGIETNKTLVLHYKINAGDMMIVHTGEKSVALQKDETDQIYGEVLV